MSFTIGGSTPALPLDSTILVTGANGFVGSHICDQFLAHGYRVRGTVRDIGRSQWIQARFDAQYGPGRFELVQATDLTVPGALDPFLADGKVAGVAHTATKIAPSAGGDARDVIHASVAAANAVLASAIQAPAVRRFVFTSSGAAVDIPTANAKVPRTISGRDWNVAAVTHAWLPQAAAAAATGGDEGAESAASAAAAAKARVWNVNHASKVHSEAALWATVREVPEDGAGGLVMNSVLPYSMFGPALGPEGHATSGLLIQRPWEARDLREIEFAARGGFRWFLNVVDNARLHVAAMLDPDVRCERLLGAAGKWNGWTVKELLEKFAAETPGMEAAVFADPAPGDFWCIDEAETGRELEVLRRLGRDGFVGLEKSARETLGLPSVAA